MRAFSAFSGSTWVCWSHSWDELNNCWCPGVSCEMCRFEMRYIKERTKRKKVYNQDPEAGDNVTGNIQVFCQCCPFRKEELSAGIVTVVDSDVSLMVISVLGEMPSALRFRSLWLRCWCMGKVVSMPRFFQQYQQKVEFFMRPCLEKSIRSIQKTPGGLLYGQRWSNMWSVLKTPEFRALLCTLPVTCPL